MPKCGIVARIPRVPGAISWRPPAVTVFDRRSSASNTWPMGMGIAAHNAPSREGDAGRCITFEDACLSDLACSDSRGSLISSSIYFLSPKDVISRTAPRGSQNVCANTPTVHPEHLRLTWLATHMYTISTPFITLCVNRKSAMAIEYPILKGISGSCVTRCSLPSEEAPCSCWHPGSEAFPSTRTWQT